MGDYLDRVRLAAKQKIIFTPHAIRQMSRPERMITPTEVKAVIEKGVLIEDYPDDQRGHSCLLLGFAARGVPIHLVCAAKEEYLAIITAYIPNRDEWTNDFKTRKSK